MTEYWWFGSKKNKRPRGALSSQIRPRRSPWRAKWLPPVPERGMIPANGCGHGHQKAGDRVLFSKYAGTEIKIDGVEHLFMREDDILGVIVIKGGN
jgi:hypothetical protein